MIIRMGHREDLLVGAMTCLREKGYARTTARDIVAASGTNLGSIGYHYGSTEALLNAAVLASVDEWGTQLGSAMAAKIDPDAPFLMRFEQYWAAVLATFEDYRQVWAATFDLLGVAERVPQIRAAVADGLDDGSVTTAGAGGVTGYRSAESQARSRSSAATICAVSTYSPGVWAISEMPGP